MNERSAEVRPARVGGRNLKQTVTIVYALQALSFVLPVAFIVGVVVDYIERDDARGTWLESHVRWQIRTFWFTLLWAVIGAMTYFLVIGALILAAAGVWLIYRIAKGWLRLADNRPV